MTSKRIIGWTGVASNLKYLLSIESALAAVLERLPDAILRVVSGARPQFRLLDDVRVQFIPWSPGNDVETIREMSIGLMPIEDSPWGRGKCSYKMLQYMSCGLPVVVSPVGMNKELLALGKVGFGPQSDAEWVDCISWLLENPEKGREMGAVGRKIVQESYSIPVLAPRLAGYIRIFAE
jgi:glycosyltransferase involved in cell wall biosynthesis